MADGCSERVCIDTIYRAVFAGLLGMKATECLRTRRPRRRRQACHGSKRPGLPDIGYRPAIVNERGELGHWEGDQIIGQFDRSSMLWLTERVTRFSIGVTMSEGYAGESMLGGLCCGLDQIPDHILRSTTFDQGNEWACWRTIAATYGIDVWYRDLHSLWQRSQVESLNRQWRFWFPSGADLGIVDQAHADHAALIINGQRRRKFGYESPVALCAPVSVQ